MSLGYYICFRCLFSWMYDISLCKNWLNKAPRAVYCNYTAYKLLVSWLFATLMYTARFCDTCADFRIIRLTCYGCDAIYAYVEHINGSGDDAVDLLYGAYRYAIGRAKMQICCYYFQPPPFVASVISYHISMTLPTNTYQKYFAAILAIIYILDISSSYALTQLCKLDYYISLGLIYTLIDFVDIT